MPWSGAGTYSLPPAYSPEVNGTVIDATRYNGLTTDVAAGITAALAKNGENTPTANLPMGGFKHTGVADANAAGQYIAFNQATAVGSLTITALTTTTLVAGNLNVTSSTVPANGVYLPAVNTLGLSSNTTLRWSVNSTGAHVFAAASAGSTLLVNTGAVANVFVGGAANHAGIEFAGNGQSAGSASFFVGQDISGDAALLQRANRQMYLGTNGSNRVIISAAGNFSVQAPASGDGISTQQATSSDYGIRQVQSSNGGTIQWSVANGSNTVNSDSRFIIQTAGSSGGDPYLVFSIVGVTAWSVGADNSNSDACVFTSSTPVGANNRFVITTDGRLYGDALHNNAGSNTGTANQYILSGTYTPTLTNTTNVASSSFTNSPPAKWTRVGNVVTVSGHVSVQATSGAAALTALGISVPIASNFAIFEDLSGTASDGNQSAGTANSSAGLQADVANDRATLYYRANNTNTSIFAFIFSYTVL